MWKIWEMVLLSVSAPVIVREGLNGIDNVCHRAA